MISLLAQDTLGMEVSSIIHGQDHGIEQLLTSTRCLRLGLEEEIRIERREFVRGYAAETWCQ